MYWVHDAYQQAITMRWLGCAVADTQVTDYDTDEATIMISLFGRYVSCYCRAVVLWVGVDAVAVVWLVLLVVVVIALAIVLLVLLLLLLLVINIRIQAIPNQSKQQIMMFTNVVP